MSTFVDWHKCLRALLNYSIIRCSQYLESRLHDGVRERCIKVNLACGPGYFTACQGSLSCYFYSFILSIFRCSALALLSITTASYYLTSGKCDCCLYR